jgi:hypothetical protein
MRVFGDIRSMRSAGGDAPPPARMSSRCFATASRYLSTRSDRLSFSVEITNWRANYRGSG